MAEAATPVGPPEGENMRNSQSLESADPESPLDEETLEIFRVRCPDCRQPIALLADEDVLPEHAMCPTPWNPFGLSVCSGSGRAVEDAGPSEDGPETEEQHVAVLLTLPEGLDWRRQPFSHVGGPGSGLVGPRHAP
jgi:hypothetical protein